jgi:hypothetical protein
MKSPFDIDPVWESSNTAKAGKMYDTFGTVTRLLGVSQNGSRSFVNSEPVKRILRESFTLDGSGDVRRQVADKLEPLSAWTRSIADRSTPAPLSRDQQAAIQGVYALLDEGIRQMEGNATFRTEFMNSLHASDETQLMATAKAALWDIGELMDRQRIARPARDQIAR